MSAHARKIIPIPIDSGRDDDRIDLPAEYPALLKRKTDNKIIDAVMVNISSTGIGIRTSRAIETSTELSFVTLDRTISFK